ncbi:MAG: hypothetical protein NVSMB9_10240 [Isosphaeraceae bacterium]
MESATAAEPSEMEEQGRLAEKPKEGGNNVVPPHGIAVPADPRPTPGGLGGTGVRLDAAVDRLPG